MNELQYEFLDLRSPKLYDLQRHAGAGKCLKERIGTSYWF